MTEKGCDNCYYTYFDERAYPCSLCIRGIERTDQWQPSRKTKADRKTEQTEPRLEQFRVGLEYHTDSVNFGKPKGESITTNKTEPQIEKCPFDDSLPCGWVCTEYGKCKYKPQTEPQTDCSWK